MNVLAVEGSQLAAALDRLLEVEPELPYANFQPIASRRGAAAALHRELWTNPAAGLAWVAYEESGEPVAAVRAERREFESEHFGMEAFRLEPPIAVREGPRRLAALRALYSAAVDGLRSIGARHVAARSSTRDRSTPWALQDNGFYHVDTQVSWMCALTGTPHDEALPPNLHLEVHDRTTIRTIPSAAWRRLAEWAGTAFDRGPFVFDHTVPYEQACRIYQVWTAKMMGGEWADAVLLVRTEDEVVAYISMLELPEVSAASGLRVFGRGLGATLPGYRGLFTAIQREMIARRPLGADFMENETQVATIGSINVYAKLGFRYLRSTATFHLNLAAAMRPPSR